MSSEQIHIVGDLPHLAALTVDELEAFIRRCRRLGIDGSSVPTVRVNFKGGMKKIEVTGGFASSAQDGVNDA